MDNIVWDVLDPFAPPDPTQHRLRTLIQAEITRMRRHELVGPLQSIHTEEDAFPYDDDDDDDDSDDESYVDDADDEQEEEEEKPLRIIPPRLLHAHPICYVPSPPPSPTPSSSDGDSIGPLSDLSSTDDDQAEADERARKAKRDAHRSRLKALAILGPEAATAISSMMPGSEI